MSNIAAADPTAILALIRRVQAAEAELAATQAAIAEWRQEIGEMQADSRLVEALDRIKQEILE